MQKKKSNISRKMNYPIGDFLIRLKNAVIAGRKEVNVPVTKLLKSVAEVLKKEGFLSDVKADEDNLSVTLAIRRKEPILMDVQLVSKPGLRVYMKLDELQSKKGPYIAIVSTPLGVMSSQEAIKKKTGGEVIAKIF
jgi:small subunit ribosomal protein S8